MVNKVNNQLMSFTSFGGNCHNCSSSKSRLKNSRHRRGKRHSRRRRRSSKRHSRRRRRSSKRHSRRRRRHSSKRHNIHRSRRMKGGFIRSGSRVLNWGDTCKNTGKPFNLEY